MDLADEIVHRFEEETFWETMMPRWAQILRKAEIEMSMTMIEPEGRMFLYASATGQIHEITDASYIAPDQQES